MFKTIRMYAGLALVIVVAATAAYVGWTLRGPAAALAQPVVRHTSTALKIEQVRKLSHLATLHVPISDVQISELSGWTGGVRAILVVKGDVEIVTDLDQAAFESMDAQKKTAVLVLPPPTLSRPRVDHEGTRVYEVRRSGLWSYLPGAAGEAELTGKAMTEAQRLIGRTANRPELIEQARSRAQDVLGRFFEAMGWTVEVKWADRMAEESPRSTLHDPMTNQ